MKIPTKNDLPITHGQTGQRHTAIAPSRKFHEIFQYQLTEKERLQKNTLSAPVPAPVASPTLLAGPMEKNGQLVNNIEKALQTLDTYAEKMADTRVGMHQLHPLVSEIKGQQAQLSKLAPMMAENRYLKAIYDDTMTLIGNEMEQFNQGAYVHMA